VVPLGLASITFMITGNTTLQLTTSSKMRGRVMSLYSVVFLGSTPIGAPLAGWVGQELGPRVGLVAGGLVAVLASAVALLVLRRARDRVDREHDVTTLEAPVAALVDEPVAAGRSA
jgi:MFS family permease